MIAVHKKYPFARADFIDRIKRRFELPIHSIEEISGYYNELRMKFIHLSRDATHKFRLIDISQMNIGKLNNALPFPLFGKSRERHLDTLHNRVPGIPYPVEGNTDRRGKENSGQYRHRNGNWKKRKKEHYSPHGKRGKDKVRSNTEKHTGKHIEVFCKRILFERGKNGCGNETQGRKRRTHIDRESIRHIHNRKEPNQRGIQKKLRPKENAHNRHQKQNDEKKWRHRK